MILHTHDDNYRITETSTTASTESIPAAAAAIKLIPTAATPGYAGGDRKENFISYFFSLRFFLLSAFRFLNQFLKTGLIVLYPVLVIWF